MFEFTTTERFAFERYWNLDSSGRSPYAVAVRELGWRRLLAHGSRLTSRCARAKRGDDWYTSAEIRSIDQ